MKQQQNNSRRTQKRNKRNFTGSRCNRRARKRLDIAIKGYERAIAAANGDPTGYTEPGAMNYH